MREKQLKGGLIPVGSECPFKEHCEMAKDDSCFHTGKSHPVSFSCAIARAFDMFGVPEYMKKDAG